MPRWLGAAVLAASCTLSVSAAWASPTGDGEASLLAQLSGTQGAREVMAVTRRPAFFNWPSPSRPQPTAQERQALEPLAEAAAQQHGVAIDFFKRLIRQESGYNRYAVSFAGAQGIAQFMPGTAAMMGLDDPFDPAKALPKSAELLALLHRRLGNQGLAAAAYNAGEGRVRAWLSGQGGLPLETRNYVRAITGRDAHEWAPAGLAAALMPGPLAPSRAPAFTGLSARMSPEWAFALTILPRASGPASLAAAAPARRPAAAQASMRAERRGARPPSGESSLCESMRSTGCIVAAVY
ncbi:hypothetical protein ASF28_18690 [Methylobacterium sp. Leaf99]|uniref:lytic transglycosylase domain-containing protein n=1 Tax=Methylobacterium sp. Leaf99 TaxID=1736251 RepID=UPI0006FD14A1|nr:lytic transglycosylase domain-containing protein [Methylobacterium sp. Leaf99]KQP04860.1 hypothetical protein ASF28_18690 [Methylobacterium sp. Leaf99]